SDFVRLIYPIIPRKFAVGLKNTWQHVIRPYKKANYSQSDVLREPIYQIIMISDESEQEKIEKEFSFATITRSNPYSIDIIPKGGSKLRGIQIFCNHFGIDISETMAFGDSWNDMEMIEGVGFGVAMGNAVEELKEKADFVTTSNDKDGIARAFMQFGLLDESLEEMDLIVEELSMADLLVTDAQGIQYSLLPDVLEEETKASEFKSMDTKYNQASEFHKLFDGKLPKTPHVLSDEQASFRVGFKVEEIVEYLYATSNNDSEKFAHLVDLLISDIHKAVGKITAKGKPTEHVLSEQADALIDLLYFTYGTFALMGVDPHELYNIVHQANMGKMPDTGQPIFDEQTGKLLKPDDWHEKFAPEKEIHAEIMKQIENTLHQTKKTF
ncbi:MAG: Cof-type HAD-IIB family hydrolase, partial [Streptococcaceae bacterium]|nr:Cof-type HAD-IIB family hydrolase [Streptococcaceae bacterium]